MGLRRTVVAEKDDEGGLVDDESGGQRVLAGITCRLVSYLLHGMNPVGKELLLESHAACFLPQAVPCIVMRGDK